MLEKLKGGGVRWGERSEVAVETTSEFERAVEAVC